jgi:hypothetical protein
MELTTVIVSLSVVVTNSLNESFNRIKRFHYFVFRIKNFLNITFQLFFLGLNILDGERNDCSTNLHRHGVMSFESKLIFEKNDSSELGGVILDIETIRFTLNDSMASTNTDIVDSYLTLMTSS